MKRYYIGLAATLHDPAVAIVDPAGRPVFAEATERYLQNKRAYNCPPDDMIRMPSLIDEHCGQDAELVAALNWSDAFLAQLDALCGLPSEARPPGPHDDVLGWPLPDPRALTQALRHGLRQAGLNLTSSRHVRQPVAVRRFDHHLAHAASAYASPFAECCVAVVDGFGEGTATACYHYRDGRLTALGSDSDASPFQPTASLGHFYSRLCALCGFDPLRGEEWKVMGLAPYGERDPELYDLLRPTIEVRGLTLAPGLPDAEIADRLRRLRQAMRPPGSSPLEAADLARTGQEIFEEILLELLSNLWRRQPCDALVLAGGCALNSSANGKVVERTPFRELHVPSAPADDGTALGAALLAFYADHPEAVPLGGPATPYLGSSLDPGALDRLLRFGGLGGVERLGEEAPARAAELLARGRIVGWVQGAAEYGPRALGNRSILADPRPADMKDRINDGVKFREEFRPFAPAILDAHGAEYFRGYQTSPYMDRTLVFRPEVRNRVPAVVHVNGTGRLQSVRREWNPRFHDLIAAFHAATGVPLVLNTSFNVMGKPIMHSVEDALGVFFTTGLDALFVEDYLLQKESSASASPAEGSLRSRST